VIHLDTNFLINVRVVGSPEQARLRNLIDDGEELNISTPVWAEFLCGPVTSEHVGRIANYFPNPEPFTAKDATTAADLFNRSGRRRGSLLDCMIAAISLRVGAAVCTANVSDFMRLAQFGVRVIRAS
jgi:predicted nucleic acid-binding protein